jgi:hypothetical protein
MSITFDLVLFFFDYVWPASDDHFHLFYTILQEMVLARMQCRLASTTSCLSWPNPVLFNSSVVHRKTFVTNEVTAALMTEI